MPQLYFLEPLGFPLPKGISSGTGRSELRLEPLLELFQKYYLKNKPHWTREAGSGADHARLTGRQDQRRLEVNGRNASMTSDRFLY